MDNQRKVFFNKVLTKSLKIEEKNGDRWFTGILTVEMKDRQGEILVISELMKVLPIWLERGGILTDTHSNRHVGRGINYQKVKVRGEDGAQYDAIEITGKIFKNYQLDNDIWEKMKDGEYRGLSFGGATKSDRIPTVWKDGSIAYKLMDLEHYEVAICREPAVPLALITNLNTLAKSIQKSNNTIAYTKRNNEQICIQCTNVGCYVEKSVLINKPFAGFKDWDACKAAGNSDELCGYLKHKTEDAHKSVGEQIGQKQGELSGYGEEEGKEEFNKGLVEDMAHEKCMHCGYTPSSGTDSLQEHIMKEHPYTNKEFPPKEKKPKENKPEEDESEENKPDEEKQLERDSKEEEPGHFDPGIKHPSAEAREAQRIPQHEKPEIDAKPMSDLMIDTPTIGTGINAKDHPSQADIQSHDTPEPSKLNDSQRPNGDEEEHLADSIKPHNELSNEDENNYDHYGTGRDTVRNEDQNLSPTGSSNEDEKETKPNDPEEEIDERPKDTIKAELFTLKELGYVESQTPKQCQTCEYFTFPTQCKKTASPVNPVKGCCNKWDPQKELRGDILNITKAPIVVGDHKQYADMQPQNAQVSTDTAYDPEPEKAIASQGDVGMGNFGKTLNQKSVYAHSSPVDTTKPDENDNSNLNSTPQPMTVGQNTLNPDIATKSINSLKITLLASKIKSIKKSKYS